MGKDISVVVQRHDGDQWVDVPIANDAWCKWNGRDRNAWWLLGGYGCRLQSTPLTEVFDGWPSVEIPDWFVPDPSEPLLPVRRGFPGDFEINGGGERHGHPDEWFGYYHGDTMMGDYQHSWMTHAELLTTSEVQRHTRIGEWLQELGRMRLGDPERVRVVFGFD